MYKIAEIDVLMFVCVFWQHFGGNDDPLENQITRFLEHTYERKMKLSTNISIYKNGSQFAIHEYS